jgi:Tfp pilus assembly protein PilF
VSYWRRAQAVNPWDSSYHFNLARQFSNHQDWPHAIEECQAAIRLDPGDSDSHRLMVLCWIRTGAIEKARQEMEIALALKPDQADALHKWFEELAKKH